jgi:single-stranded-DNA-specific exonuclease
MLDSLSTKGKIWQLPPDIEPTAELLAITEQSSLLAKIMLGRGISSPEEAQAFLSPEHYSPTDSFELPDVDKAIIRINQALANNEQITVYGDYDVDGITATSLMLTALQKISAKVGYYIPNRASEGYGLNLKAVSILASKQKTKLIISCDCGVSNFAEINFAKSLGVDTIILDHHALPELLPPARAIVHPKLLLDSHPLFHLPGVGVAYKVAEALLAEHNLASHTEEFLDYVTLGMIADLVPLIRENRYLVQIGLPKLIKSPRPGIQALLSQVQPSSDTDIVGFGLAPRINAVGRLADAQVAVELLTTDNRELANKLSNQLQNDNTKRQQICEQVFSEAEQAINALGNLAQQNAISIYKEGWHHGVVGIVASRLVEKYHRPVFIAELDAQEGIVKGSARGISSLDLCEILKANAHLLTKWGGHKMAAGFSLPADKAEAFCAAIVGTCNQMMANKSRAPIINVDVTLEDTTLDLFAFAKTLTKLAPFGMENKKPIFFASKLSSAKISPLGRDGKHHRLDLVDKQNDKTFSCVFWNTNNIIPTANDVIDIVFTPEINTFNGKERLQLVLADWRLSNPKTIAVKAESAKAITVQSSAITINDSPALTSIEAVKNSITNTKQAFVDLRHFENSKKIVTTAITTLGDKLSIFCEEPDNSLSMKSFDRLSLPKRPHLLIKQFPPSPAVWQQIVTTSDANKIYILGDSGAQSIDSTFLIKRLMGLVRFVVNKKSGEVEASRIAAALATTDLACALALALLRKLELVDWYSDQGIIYFDLLDNPAEKDIKQLSEYTQLEEILKEINKFRLWCASASLSDLNSRVLNNPQEPTQPNDIATAELDFSVINTMQSSQYLDNVTTVKGSLA